MSNLAIIPARGGSKRIPRKNLKDFLGKPIIAYSIEAALQSGLFEEVMVSTDDQEIKNISKKYGAKCPFYRSSETSNDFATTIAVIMEVVSEYKLQFNKVFDRICCIYPTAPLIQIQHLKNGLDLMLSKNSSSTYPVVAFSYPIWRGLEITVEGKTQMIWPEYLNSRSQDLKIVFHDAGQWYWYRTDKLDNSEYIKNVHSIILNEDEVQDIDNLTDWKLAEMKFRLLNFEKNME